MIGERFFWNSSTGEMEAHVRYPTLFEQDVDLIEAMIDIMPSCVCAGPFPQACSTQQSGCDNVRRMKTLHKLVGFAAGQRPYSKPGFTSSESPKAPGYWCKFSSWPKYGFQVQEPPGSSNIDDREGQVRWEATSSFQCPESSSDIGIALWPLWAVGGGWQSF